MRLHLVALLALAAGCSQARLPPAPAAPAVPAGPGRLPLATFVGEVDMAAGTVTVTTTHSGASSGTRLVLPTGRATFDIANDGAPWNGVRSPTGACSGAATTGAKVALTLGADVPSTKFFGALYARITDVSGTGVYACNSQWTQNPQLTPNNGLWEYGTLGAVSPTPVTSTTAEWDWLTSSAAKFKFAGEIDGWIGTRYTAFSGGLTEQALSFNGTSLVLASGSSSRMSLVTLDGVEILVPLPESAPAPVKRVFADTVNGRIWFTAESGGDSWVGYTNLDGTGLRSVSLSSISEIRALAVSTVPGARTAWVAENLSGHVHSATIGDTGDLAQDVVFTYPNVGMLAYGSDGNLWVAVPNGDRIQSYSTAGVAGPAWLLPDPEFQTDCKDPIYLVPGLPGTLYFTHHGMYGDGICAMGVATGGFSQIGMAWNPGGIAVGPGPTYYTVSKYAPNSVIEAFGPYVPAYSRLAAQVYEPTVPSDSLNAVVSVPGVVGGRNNAVWAVNGQGLYELQVSVAGSSFVESSFGIYVGYDTYWPYPEQSIAFVGSEMAVNVSQVDPGPPSENADTIAFVSAFGNYARVVPSQASMYPIGHFANSGSPTRVWYMHLGTDFASCRTTVGFFDATGLKWQEAVLYNGSTVTDWKLFSPIAVRYSDENAAWTSYAKYQAGTDTVIATGIARVDWTSDATPPTVTTFLELAFTSPGPGYQVRHAAPAGPDGRVLAYVVHLDENGNQDGAEFRAYGANGSLQATKDVWGKDCGESATNLGALGHLWYDPAPGTLWFEARDPVLDVYEICALDLTNLTTGPDPEVVVMLTGGRLLQTANPYTAGPDGTPWIIAGGNASYGPVTGGAGTGVYTPHVYDGSTFQGITSGAGTIWTIGDPVGPMAAYWW